MTLRGCKYQIRFFFFAENFHKHLNTVTIINDMASQEVVEGEGLQCCGKHFIFDFTGKSSVKFYGVEGTTILVVYVQDGQIVHSGQL